jgi:hypothetical protein
VPTLKLFPGGIAANRYYLEFNARDQQQIRSNIAAICDALQMPGELLSQVDRLVERRPELMLGVADDDGPLAYKLYLARASALPSRMPRSRLQIAEWERRMSVHEATSRSTPSETPAPLISLGWRPDGSVWSMKEYDLMPPLSSEGAAQCVRDALACSWSESVSAVCHIDPDRLAGELLCILERTDFGKHVLRVREGGTKRYSFDFHLRRTESIRLDHVRHHVCAIAHLMDTAASRVESWLVGRGDSDVANLAVGKTNHGRPFVSIYLAGSTRPPSYVGVSPH